jgi:hypothetical protein
MSKASRRSNDRVPIEHAISLLAPALGWEKSTEIIESIAKQLALTSDRLTPVGVIRIFEALGEGTDLVGAAARLARVRFEQSFARVATDPPPKPHQVGSSLKAEKEEEPPASSVRVVQKPLPVSELVALLTPALGAEKSESVVGEATAARGLQGDTLTPDDAVAVIDHLAKEDGLISVVARFAKARLLLRLKKG